MTINHSVISVGLTRATLKASTKGEASREGASASLTWTTSVAMPRDSLETREEVFIVVLMSHYSFLFIVSWILIRLS